MQLDLLLLMSHLQINEYVYIFINKRAWVHTLVVVVGTHGTGMGGVCTRAVGHWLHVRRQNCQLLTPMWVLPNAHWERVKNPVKRGKVWPKVTIKRNTKEQTEGRRKERRKEGHNEVDWLFGFYGISTLVGYSMPNPFLYKSVLFQTIQFNLSILFNYQKHFIFKLFRFFKQF